jgi:hypothetical protein
VERDSRPEISSPFPELRDAEYRWFVTLWGEAQLADDQLTSRYGILGHRSAIELLRESPRWFSRVPFLRERRRERILHWIREAHGMNRAGTYA